MERICSRNGEDCFDISENSKIRFLLPPNKAFPKKFSQLNTQEKIQVLDQFLIGVYQLQQTDNENQYDYDLVLTISEEIIRSLLLEESKKCPTHKTQDACENFAECEWNSGSVWKLYQDSGCRPLVSPPDPKEIQNATSPFKFVELFQQIESKIEKLQVIPLQLRDPKERKQFELLKGIQNQVVEILLQMTKKIDRSNKYFQEIQQVQKEILDCKLRKCSHKRKDELHLSLVDLMEKHEKTRTWIKRVWNGAKENPLLTTGIAATAALLADHYFLGGKITNPLLQTVQGNYKTSSEWFTQKLEEIKESSSKLKQSIEKMYQEKKITPAVPVVPVAVVPVVPVKTPEVVLKAKALQGLGTGPIQLML